MPGLAMHACNPSTGETETGTQPVQTGTFQACEKTLY